MARETSAGFRVFLGLLIGIAGIAAALWAIPHDWPVVSAAGGMLVVFGVFGGVMGAFAPQWGWRGGLVLLAPTAVMLALSIAFTGDLVAFAKRDLPLLAGVGVGSCVGAFAGAWLRLRNQDAA